MPVKSLKTPQKTDDLKDKKISIFFKKSILKSILKILTMEHPGYRTLKALKNINGLFNNLDLSKYSKNQELLSYIWCIQYISKEWLDGMIDINLIYEKAKREKDFDNIKSEIIASSIADDTIMSSPQIKLIFDLISEALQFGYVVSMREQYLSLLEEISLDDPAAFKELVNRLFKISESLMDIKYNTNLVANKITFNTADADSMKESISQTISSLSKSNNILKTGIRRLNTLLSPGYMNGRIYVYLGASGGGKAQPNDTPIPTPSGIKRLDELKIGDYVYNLYGRPVKVQAIFPQGIQETYKVTFTDGRSTRCNLDHLWLTLKPGGKNGKYVPDVKSLREIMKDYKYSESEYPNKVHYKYIIPNNKVTYFDHRNLPINPWCLGYMIGNGNLSEGLFTLKAEHQYSSMKFGELMSVTVCKSHIPGEYFFKKRNLAISTKDILGEIDELYNRKKHEIRIPEDYLYNSETNRMGLLRGLMDSDLGSITKKLINRSYYTFKVEFDSYSNGLTEDMMFLLESLGIKYQIKEKKRKKVFNIKIPYFKMFRIFSAPDKFPLALEARMHKKIRKYNHTRICNIEKVEDTEQRCILIDDPTHVYLTEHFIPTHNSLLLLKSALDIRKYNPGFQAKTPGMKPCVLYITMENSFTETIERIWNLRFDDAITNYSEEEATEKIVKELKSTYSQIDSLIDRPDGPTIEVVIKYFPYREISTDDLFIIIQDLKEENLEVCALVLDYIKRIRPSVVTPDNVKLELDHIMNELKALSIIKDIPVITAHQMNRAAAAIIDNASRSSKADATKLVGREHVGSSWEIIETADFAAVLNIEFKPGTDDRYMVINVVKRRRIDTEESDFAKYTYLAHPFAKKGLRLLDDMNLDKVLSVQTLSTDIATLGVEKDKTNAVPRLKINTSDFDDPFAYEDDL